MNPRRRSLQRSSTSALASVAGLVAFLGAAPVARAYPNPPPPPCTFALSMPVIEGDVVSATVQSQGCAPMAAPYSSIACLQPGDGAMQDCAQAHGADPARVSVTYRPGVFYVATGRGCARWVGFPPASNCQLLGPAR